MSGIQNLIGDEQSLHWLATDNMRLDDFVHIFRLDVSVPDRFGINHHRGAKFALVEAAGFVGAHQLDAALGQLGFEEALQLALAGGVAAAAGVAGFSLVHADKNMLFKFWHDVV
jgi:hypothetical protein